MKKFKKILILRQLDFCYLKRMSFSVAKRLNNPERVFRKRNRARDLTVDESKIQRPESKYRLLLRNPELKKKLESFQSSVNNLYQELPVTKLDSLWQEKKTSIKFANYNALYFSMRSLQSYLNRLAKNINSSSKAQRKQLQSIAINVLPELLKVARLKPPSVSIWDGEILKHDNILFDLFEAREFDPEFDFRSVRNRLFLPQNVYQDNDVMRFGLFKKPNDQTDTSSVDSKYAELSQFSWQKYDEVYNRNLADFEYDEVENPKACAFNQTVENLILQPLAQRAEATWQTLVKAYGNKSQTSLKNLSEIQISSLMSNASSLHIDNAASLAKSNPEPELIRQAKSQSSSRVKPKSKPRIQEIGSAFIASLNPLQSLQALEKFLEKKSGSMTTEKLQAILKSSLEKFTIKALDQMSFEDKNQAYDLLISFSSSVDVSDNERLTNLFIEVLQNTANNIFCHKQLKQEGIAEVDARALSNYRFFVELKKNLESMLDYIQAQQKQYKFADLDIAGMLKRFYQGHVNISFATIKEKAFSKKQSESLRALLDRIINIVPLSDSSHHFVRNLSSLKMHFEQMQESKGDLEKPNTVKKVESPRSLLSKWKDSIKKLASLATTNIRNVRRKLQSQLNEILSIARNPQLFQNPIDEVQNLEDSVLQVYENFTKLKKRDVKVENAVFRVADEVDRLKQQYLENSLAA